MKKKNLYIIGGVVLVGAIAYIMYTKKKKKEAAQSQLDTERREKEAADEIQAKLDAEIKEAEEKEKAELAKCITMGELRTTENHQWVGVPFDSREKANQIVIGTKVEIKKTEEGLDGEYDVLETWKDKNGNVGAIDIAHTLDLPKTLKGKKGDERFSGTGLICIK